MNTAIHSSLNELYTSLPNPIRMESYVNAGIEKYESDGLASLIYCRSVLFAVIYFSQLNVLFGAFYHFMYIIWNFFAKQSFAAFP